MSELSVALKYSFYSFLGRADDQSRKPATTHSIYNSDC